MSKPFFMLRAIAPAAFALAALVAPHGASAQYWGGWGPPPGRVFGPPPVVYGGPDDFAPPGAIAGPRMVAQILNARGYRLVSAPHRAGDRFIAVGEDRRGERVRFVIDAYDGALIRVVRGEAAYPVARIVPPGDIPYGAPDGEYGEQPMAAPMPGHAPRAQAKPKAKPRTAARNPVEPKVMTPTKPAPTEATRPPAAPTPAPAAVAPAPASPPQAAVAPAPQTPLAPDARPPENAKPADIGPRVEPVARAPESALAPPAAPPAAAPAEPAPAAPASDQTK